MPGAPDLIIEILSPGTATLDRIHKLALYERHKVREFWIVDPEQKSVEIRPLGPDGRYGAPVIRAGAGWNFRSADDADGRR